MMTAPTAAIRCDGVSSQVRVEGIVGVPFRGTWLFPDTGVGLRPFGADTTVNAHPRASMPRYRILVVDDSKLVHELVRMALETQAGWEIRCAASGSEALALAAAEPPDAVLLDVEMPELDGPATLAALR